MNCDEVEELLGAYAVDALPSDEAAAVRAHLAGCRNHAEQAAELRAVASRLHALAGPVQPPAALRSRVLEAIREQDSATATARATAPAVPPASIESARDTRRSRVTWGRSPEGKRAFPYARGALAAVLVAAIGGLLAWNIILMSGDDNDAEQFASRATAVAPLRADAGDAFGAVIYFDAEKRAAVVADGLEVLDATQTYQLWALGEGDPVSLGLISVDARGHMSGAVSFDAAAAEGIAITIEPAAGSPQPTSDPILLAEL
jgi:anti-sigma-K factor RskA